MREIKFRAWIKNQKRMAQVSGILFDSEQIECPDFDQTEYIADNIFNFDEIELMQYTGLKDKRGQKIYERDVVRQDWHNDGVIVQKGNVFWHEDRGMWAIDNSDYDNFPMDDWHEVEVIGNIYENPDELGSR